MIATGCKKEIEVGKSETSGCRDRRQKENFFEKYIKGEGIDIGCGKLYGYDSEDKIDKNAIAHDKDMCDAHKMHVFRDCNFDYVYSSHVLEHLEDPVLAIKNWYRITKNDGFLIIAVPSKFRYEKKRNPPSRWNGDHKIFYTPALLISQIEEALEPNSYLIEYVKDCANNFKWEIPAEKHSSGEYQIECVIKKITKPKWNLL